MAHDFDQTIDAKIKWHREALAALEAIKRIEGSPPKGSTSIFTEEGSLMNRPAAWNVADDIEKIMEAGALRISDDELIQRLLGQGALKGSDEKTKISNARKSISRGLRDGYMRRREDNLLEWIPGKRENTRVAKKYRQL